MAKNPSAPALARLNVFIGRWITEGETVPDGDAGAARILASDVYQWVPAVISSCTPHTGGSGQPRWEGSK